MTIKLSEYVHLAEDKNLTPALRAAVEGLAEGDTLVLDMPRIELYAAGAYNKEYYISNNDGGEKPLAFPLIGKKNVTVDGQNAELIFHGRILPFAIDVSEGVTVKNLSIDYASPFYAQALIVEADEEHTLMQFDNREFFCRVGENGEFVFSGEDNDELGIAGWKDAVESCLVMEFDADRKAPSAFKPPYFPYTGEKKDHGFLGGMFRDVKLKDYGNGLIGMYGKLGFVHTVGNYWLCTHSSREFPGFLITDSKDTVIENITLYHTASMGVVGQKSENITLNNVRAEVRDGTERMLSTNADATHFVNCRGKIELIDCKFVSMMDDALNIHGIYPLIKKKKDEHTYLLGYGHIQHRGMQIFEVGDRAAVIDKITMETLCTGKVLEAGAYSPDEAYVVLDCALPEPSDYEEDRLMVENLSTAPEIHICGCESGNNRPRGFLVSSAGDTLIENCTFYNMNCGVQIGGEVKNWYESGATKNVVIRNNRFANSAYAGGAAVTLHKSLYCDSYSEYFLGSVTIEGNTFIQKNPRLLAGSGAAKLVFRGNTFISDDSLPAHGKIGENGVGVYDCGETEIEDVICMEGE